MRLQSVFVIFACLVLSACVVPSDVIMLQTPSVDAPFDYATTGVVTVQVADTTPFATAYPINQLTFAPQDVEASDESKYLRAVPIVGKGQSTRLFTAELPAGDYSIASLRTFESFGESYFSQYYPAGVQLGTFKVEPGRLTDLGVLVVYVKRSGDDYSFATTRAPSVNRATNYLRSDLPQRAAAVTNLDAPLTWDDDGLDDDRYNAYVNAVSRQISLGLPDIDESTGSVTFPGPLGVLLTRTSDRDWELNAFDDDVELMFYNETSDREWLITEFEEVFERAGPDADWARIGALSGTDLTPVYLDQNNGGQAFAITEHEGAVHIRVQEAAADAWQIVHTIPNPKPDRPSGPVFGRASKIARAGDNVYFTVRNILYRYGVDDRALTTVEGMKPDSLQIRNGYITATAARMFSTDKVSFDKGGSWQRFRGDVILPQPEGERRSRSTRRTRRVSAVGHPIFVSADVGYAIQDGGLDKPNYLIRTTNGAETWTRTGLADLPEGCNELVLATEAELLLGCYLTGEYYRSDDAGASWALERSVSET